MTSDALIHLRVPASTKARWVRESRAAGMRLTDWITNRVEESMTTITVSFDVPAEAFARVEMMAHEIELNDPNYNGADIRVVRGDFTQVDDSDELRGAGLFCRVQNAIDKT